jgi:teichoic acid transport system ATP-binding protein
MDEVLAVGDYNFQKKCIGEFKKYKSLGKTVILVTHDVQTVVEYCDRVLLINGGKVIKIGDSQKAVLEYQHINMSDEDRRFKREMEKNAQENKDEKNKTTYGNGKAMIYSCRILNDKEEETNVLESGKKFKVRLYIQAKKDIRDVSLNFTFKDKSGQKRLVLHTLYSRNPVKIVELKKDQKMEVIFSAEMILTSGFYIIYADICENVRYPSYEVAYANTEFLTVEVFNEKIIPDPINENYEIEVKNVR